MIEEAAVTNNAAMTDKDIVAQRLIDWHFEVEEELIEVYRFIASNQDDPKEPIKLLDINEATVEMGQVEAFGFGPSNDFPYSKIVAEVTNRELELIRKGVISLPNGWNLATAQRFPRIVESYAA